VLAAMQVSLFQDRCAVRERCPLQLTGAATQVSASYLTLTAGSKRSLWIKTAGVFALASAFGVLPTSKFSRRGRKGHTARRSKKEVKTSIPTDFYGLLGLPTYSGSRAEIRSAFRRMVKMVHPDILGGNSKELTGLLTTAYRTLSDPSLRVSYDQELRSQDGSRSGKSGAKHSKWPEDASPFAEGMFVDESQCVMCRNCVDIAPGTFSMGEDSSERAHVFQQFGDTDEDIEWARISCPTSAISRWPREDLFMLEEAMARCHLHTPDIMARRRIHGTRGMLQGSPFTVVQNLSERRYRPNRFSGNGHSPGATQVEASIKQAVSALPDEVTAKVWTSSSTTVTEVSEPTSA